jgi:hypothetical protein
LKAKKETEMVKNNLERKIQTLESQVSSGNEEQQEALKTEMEQLLAEKQKQEEDLYQKICEFEVQVESFSLKIEEKEKEMEELK